MTVINTNVKALYSQASLKVNNRDMTHAMQMLSTGLRINSSKDDAAGLAISDRMTQQIRSLNQAVRNAGDAISLIQTTEGATGEINQMLQRMRELSIQAINDTNTEDQRSYLNIEFQQLKDEITRIADMTEWNGFPVLTGEAGVRVGEMPVFKAVGEGQFSQVFIQPTTVRPITGDDAGEIQEFEITGFGSTASYVTVDGVQISLTAVQNGSIDDVGARIEEGLQLSTEFGSGSGRTVSYDSTTNKIRIEFAATEGDVDDVVFDPVGSGITAGAIATINPAVVATNEEFSTASGRFLKSGTISISIPAATTATDTTISATFTDTRGEATTMTGTLNRGDSTVSFAATGNNAEILSEGTLTYTFLDSSGSAVGSTAHKGLDDWDGVGDGTGTDVGRAVSLDIAVSGGIPAMNLGDMVINGIVIESSDANDDLLSPINNAAGSAIAKAAAINEKYELTGVRAVVNENVMHGTEQSTGAQATGVVFVNGVSSDEIVTIPGDLRQTRINAANAINKISHLTGVTAVDTGTPNEGIKFIAADGRNIEVTFETDASNEDFSARTGIRNGVQASTYSLEAKVEAPIVITSDTGNVANTGLQAGDYTVNQTSMSTMDRARVDQPVPQVSKVTLDEQDLSGVGTDQTFTITINGASYSVLYDSAGDTITDADGNAIAYDSSSPFSGNITNANIPAVRDALVAVINADLELGVTAEAGLTENAIMITGNANGSQFLIDVSSTNDDITATTFTEAVASQAKVLNEGDLKINGVAIQKSLAADDIESDITSASSKRDASAIAIAAAINKHADETGVTARVNPTISIGQSTDTSADVSGSQSLFVNGVEVSVNLVRNETEAARREKVLAAINARFGQHGVIASDNGAGITLTADDGRNVSAWFDASVRNLRAAAFGLERSGTVAQINTITVTDSGADGIANGEKLAVYLNGNKIEATAASVTSAGDLAAQLAAQITAANEPNISVSVSGAVVTLTSTEAGSPFTLTGVSTDDADDPAGVFSTSIANIQRNSYGDNDVIGIVDGTVNSVGARTVYGTIDLVSESNEPFTVDVGVNGYNGRSNFEAIGLREGTFGGQSSEEMSPPKVGRLSFQVGASAYQVITVDLPDFGADGPITSLVTADANLDMVDRLVRIDNRPDAEAALEKLDTVVDQVNENRATMGAVMNRLTYAIDTLTNVSMNQTESRSRVLDADYAMASTELARTQIIQQAATAVLAQANVDQQTVLRLLE